MALVEVNEGPPHGQIRALALPRIRDRPAHHPLSLLVLALGRIHAPRDGHEPREQQLVLDLAHAGLLLDEVTQECATRFHAATDRVEPGRPLRKNEPRLVGRLRQHRGEERARPPRELLHGRVALRLRLVPRVGIQQAEPQEVVGVVRVLSPPGFPLFDRGQGIVLLRRPPLRLAHGRVIRIDLGHVGQRLFGQPFILLFLLPDGLTRPLIVCNNQQVVCSETAWIDRRRPPESLNRLGHAPGGQTSSRQVRLERVRFRQPEHGVPILANGHRRVAAGQRQCRPAGRAAGVIETRTVIGLRQQHQQLFGLIVLFQTQPQAKLPFNHPQFIRPQGLHLFQVPERLLRVARNVEVEIAFGPCVLIRDGRQDFQQLLVAPVRVLLGQEYLIPLQMPPQPRGRVGQLLPDELQRFRVAIRLLHDGHQHPQGRLPLRSVRRRVAEHRAEDLLGGIQVIERLRLAGPPEPGGHVRTGHQLPLAFSLFLAPQRDQRGRPCRRKGPLAGILRPVPVERIQRVLRPAQAGQQVGPNGQQPQRRDAICDGVLFHRLVCVLQRFAQLGALPVERGQLRGGNADRAGDPKPEAGLVPQRRVTLRAFCAGVLKCADGRRVICPGHLVAPFHHQGDRVVRVLDPGVIQKQGGPRQALLTLFVRVRQLGIPQAGHQALTQERHALIIRQAHAQAHQQQGVILGLLVLTQRRFEPRLERQVLSVRSPSRGE